MEPNYIPAFPDHVVDPSLREFIAQFYELSDKKGQDDAWVALFEDDATLVMGPRRGEGKAEIARIRSSMWDKVAKRRHTVSRVFPALFDDTIELMLFGSVEYELKEGGSTAVVDWAGHARLKGLAATGWKFSHYRVYLQN